MEKANVDKFRDIVNKCGSDNTSFINLISENGFMSFSETDSVKSVFTDDLVYFFRTSNNTSTKGSENFPIELTAMEYDTFKQLNVQLTFEGFLTFLKELGEDSSSDEWNEYIKRTKIAAISDAKGFRVDTTLNEDGSVTVENLDLDGNKITKTVPFLSPGL